jgi:hypothetical protein
MPGSQKYPFRRVRYVILPRVHPLATWSLPVPYQRDRSPSLCLFLSPRCMLIFLPLPLLIHIKSMLKSIYDQFVVLYNGIFPQHPTLAAEHALRQEQEIYDRTSKVTYRNVILFLVLLAIAGSLTFPDRHHFDRIHQETPSANDPHSSLCWHQWGSRSKARRVRRSDESAAHTIPTRAITPHA